jgi:hypothetical protein
MEIDIRFGEIGSGGSGKVQTADDDDSCDEEDVG